MTCSNTQEAIMLYHEKRIKPLKSAALQWHINKCTDCRQLFLAMDKAGEYADEYEAEALETGAADIVPEGFAEAIMAEISAIPLSERPMGVDRSVTSEHRLFKSIVRKTPADWLRLAGCVYALLLAAGLGVLYNTELFQISYSSLSTLEQVSVFLNNLSQAGQSAASNTVTAAGGFGNPILAIAAVLGLTLMFMLQREKTFGKKI